MGVHWFTERDIKLAFDSNIFNLELCKNLIYFNYWFFRFVFKWWLIVLRLLIGLIFFIIIFSTRLICNLIKFNFFWIIFCFIFVLKRFSCLIFNFCNLRLTHRYYVATSCFGINLWLDLICWILWCCNKILRNNFIILNYNFNR